MGYYRSGKAIYFKNTDEEQPVLIADCENEEKAHFILDRIAGHSSNFIKNALVTCSHEFHGDMVAKNQFVGRLNGAIDALNKLDQVKKTLFYGRDNNLIAEGQKDASGAVANFGGPDHAFPSNIAADIIHGVLGFATEAGELLEALRNAINGHLFDWVNIKEELGDAAWYAAILADAGDFEFEDYQRLIINKLRQRYADKFTAAEAVERNLAAERAILEDSNAPMRDEGDMIAGDTFGDSLTNPPRLLPAEPASGREAVEAAEQSADAAFEAVKNVDSDMTEQTYGKDSELAKSPAARLHPLPGEHLAHQPVRREDME
jgi:NTP pyrophosphatase (non-canonical NTP hydrolase)